MTALTVTTPTDRKIVLTREFDAPRRMVFAALTQPELLVRWYGARGWHLVDCQVDLRVGGRWRFVSRGPDGEQMAQSGVYRVIELPDRLVYTELFDDQSYPGETLITHDLAERDGRTTLTSSLLFATRMGRDKVLSYPMKRGVAESFDRLAEMMREIGEIP